MGRPVLVAVTATTAALGVALGGPLLATGSPGPGQDPHAGAPSSVSADRNAAAAQLPSDARELVGARTETSRTWELDDGERVTRSYAAPVTFERGGELVPIDADLVGSSAPDVAFRTERNAVTALLPDEAADPVRVEGDGAWVEFQLRGADGEVERTADDAVRYRNALPSVTTDFQSTTTGLKETLRLADRSAPSTYTYDVRLSDGLRPVALPNGRIGLRRGDETIFAFEPPFAEDAAGATGAARYAVRGAGATLELDVVVDRAWLTAPERRFPVLVDPTTTYVNGWAVIKGATQETYVQSDEPTTRHDSLATLRAGKESATRSHAALLKFDVGGVPDEAIVLAADLGLHLQGKANTSAAPLHVHDVTRPWTTAATWNSSGSAAWTSGGVVGSFISGAVTPTAGWTVWRDLKTVAESWVNGTAVNNGLKIDECCATPLNRYDFVKSTGPADQIPYFQVRWEMRQGTLPSYTFWKPDQSTVHGVQPGLGAPRQLPPVAVNVATGNLVLNAEDRAVDVSGAGNLPISRTYNSVWWGSFSHGIGWTGNEGAVDVTLLSQPDGSVAFKAPTHSVLRFGRRADGTYEPAQQTDASLAVNGTEYVVTLNDTGEQFVFFGLDKVVRRYVDPQGRTTSWNFTTDAQGRAIEGTATDAAGRWSKWFFEYSANHRRTARIETQDGLVYRYGYDSADTLISHTAPDGKVTRYEWEPAYSGASNIRLKKVIRPDGSEMRLTYASFADDRAIASYTTRAPGATVDGPTTRFAYTMLTSGTGKTTVTAPNGSTTVFFWDKDRRVTKVEGGAGAPSVSLAGTLYDNRAQPLTEPNTYQLTASASDGLPGQAGTGITFMRIDVDGDEAVHASQPCTGGGCSLSTSYTFEPAEQTPGPRMIAVTAVDAAGTRTVSCFTVTVAGEEPVARSATCTPASIEDLADGSTLDYGYTPPPTESEFPAPDDGTCYPRADGTPSYCGQNDLPNDDPAGVSALAVPEPRWGVSDQKAAVLSDPLLKALRAPWARLVVPYDVVSREADYAAVGNPRPAEVKAWLDAARGKFEVFVSFERSVSVPSRNGHLPTVAEYVAAVQAFRARYPFVRAFSAWNEPNHGKTEDPYQPTWNQPYRAGEYFHELRKLCAGVCRAYAGEMLDSDPVFGKRAYSGCPGNATQCSYLDAYRRGMGGNTARWAWHAYSDGKYRESNRLRSLLSRLGPTAEIWLTEQGAYRRQYNSKTKKIGTFTEKEANGDLRWMLDGLLTAANGRVRAFFYYQWSGEEKFDTGLVNRSRPTPRGVYRIYRRATR